MKISTAVTVAFEFEENYPGTLEQAEEGAGFKVGSSEHRKKIKEVLNEILNEEFNTGVTSVKKCVIDKFVSAASK